MNESEKGAIERSAVVLLDGLTVETIEHFGRPLRDHLVGTWRLLSSWGEPVHVCMAGLFHSVYGTGTFGATALALSERARVRGLIGERAESLVFHFGMADRRRLLLENRSPPYRWIDHRTGDATELEESLLVELVTLDVANFLEQLEARPDLPRETIRDMGFRFSVAAPWMSSGAANAWRSSFGDGSATRPLASFEPFLIAANVRGKIVSDELRVGDGRGQAGDLVVGELPAAAAGVLTIADQDRNLHTLETTRRVLAVLGPRDSSTHVCATIPPEGLEVRDGAEAHWVAGESGIVGCLERDAIADSMYSPESAARFVCAGLVMDRAGNPINIRRFAVRPETSSLSTPVVLVAATSSEAGKTALAGGLIRRLTDAGVRVGAIKATGTGGVMDSVQHAVDGAVATLDNVDAGLITTHGDAVEFRERIPLVFRKMQDIGVDLIVAELGGDLVSANNHEIFAVQEIVDHACMMLIVCNDALAAAGVQHWNRTRLRFPPSRIRFLTSPFRNHAGMARRMNRVGISRPLDPRSEADVNELAKQIVDSVRYSK